MNDTIKQRIEQIKNGEVPEGYKKTKAGFAPNDWIKGNLSDILYNEKRAITKPKNGYWRIGIRSHAKGTFHEYVENPDTVEMDELYIVKKNDLIINITFAWEHAIALANEHDDGLLVSHRFPTYVFKKGQIPYFYFNIFIQNRFKQLLANISPGGAGRNRVMSKKDFLKLPCFIPKFEEQKKIAQILMQCDKIIELYQQEIEELKKLKKAYLRKMFPKKGENVPELRFDGFTEHWEQRKLGDIADIVGGGTPSTSISEFWDGDIDWYAPAEIADQIYLASSQRKITEQGYNHSSAKLLPVGTVLFTSRAGIGKTAILSRKGCTNQGFQSIVPHKDELDSYFIFSRTEELKRYGESVGSGSTFAEVSGKQMANMELMMPKTLVEQKTIGQYFASIDNLITLHQRKLEEQKMQKKSLMQLLLTGIVRVKI